MIRILISMFICGLFFSCTRTQESSLSLSTIQMVDRLGMQETINQKEKLEKFSSVDFEKPQPYQKVTRVFIHSKNRSQGSIITTYHDNGFLKEYLEAKSNRAFGAYKEFYPDGQLKIQGTVIEGMADLSDQAKLSLMFDGMVKVYSSDATVKAIMHYNKGKLSDQSVYYHPSGKIHKKISYKEGLIDGVVEVFDEEENLLGRSEYKKGELHGRVEFFGDHSAYPFEEEYEKGLLKNGTYYDEDQKVKSMVVNGAGIQTIFYEKKILQEAEFKGGKIEGIVKTYHPSGNLQSIYQIKELCKHGQEWLYYDEEGMKPKLYLSWYQDELHGVQKSWYPSGYLESQKEMVHNLKHGQLIGWYPSQEVMMIEEYEMGKLIEGAYYSKKEAKEVSSIRQGKGIATLFDPEGYFLHKVRYDKGEIVDE